MPAAWIDGLRTLAGLPASSRLQERVLADARRCWAEGWLALAADCGWRLLDLFGAHPRAPEARQDCKGLLCLLAGRSIAQLDGDVAWIVTRDVEAGGRGSPPKKMFGFEVEAVCTAAADADPKSPFGVPGAHRFFRGGRFGGHPPSGTVPVWEIAL